MKTFLLLLPLLAIPLTLNAEENERIEDIPCWEITLPEMTTQVGDIDTYSCTFYLEDYIKYNSFTFKVTELNDDSKSIVDLFEDDKFLKNINSTTDQTVSYKFSVDKEDFTAKFQCQSDNFACTYEIETELDWEITPLGYFLLSLGALVILLGILFFFIIIGFAIVMLIRCCCKNSSSNSGSSEPGS